MMNLMNQPLPFNIFPAPVANTWRCASLFLLSSLSLIGVAFTLKNLDLGQSHNMWIAVCCMAVSHVVIWVSYFCYGENCGLWRRENLLKFVEWVNLSAQLYLGVWVSRWDNNSELSILLFGLCTLWWLSITYAVKPPEDFGICLFWVVCLLAQVTKVFGKEGKYIYIICGVCAALGLIPVWIRPRPRELEELRTTIRGHREQIETLVEESQDAQIQLGQTNDQNQQLREQLQQRTSSVQALQSQIRMLKEQAEKSQIDFRLIRDDLLRTNQLQDNEIQQLKEEISELHTKIMSVEDTASSNLRYFEQKNSSMEMERDGLKQTIQLRDNQIQDLKEQADGFRTTISSLENKARTHSSEFGDFISKPGLLRAISEAGFDYLSAVQCQCLPHSIKGRDVICQSKSGMGKTGAFVFSTLEQIKPVPGQVAALVLCHTTELAYQISLEFKRFTTYLPELKVVLVGGEIDVNAQKNRLKSEKPHIVVGTPSTVLSLATDEDLGLKNVRHIILDECDVMLTSPAMKKHVEDILKMFPYDKQVMLFSTTISKELRPICNKFLQNPLENYVEDEAKLTPHGLVQHYIELLDLEKNQKLCDLLSALKFKKVVIFVQSDSEAASLNKLLLQSNFSSIYIHSGMCQEERYKDKEIIVATDVMGRGINIKDISIVVNYNMPESPDTYLHRVGRAGRFGTKGLAISFVSESDSAILNLIRERFKVGIEKLPESIDASLYMPP